MEEFVKIAKVGDITPGRIKTLFISGKKIALANVDGEYFVIDDSCTHEQCSLGSEGFLDGNVLICGCHGSNFDVMSGKVLSLPAMMNVKSYEIKVENNEIFVKL